MPIVIVFHNYSSVFEHYNQTVSKQEEKKKMEVKKSKKLAWKKPVTWKWICLKMEKVIPTNIINIITIHIYWKKSIWQNIERIMVHRKWSTPYQQWKSESCSTSFLPHYPIRFIPEFLVTHRRWNRVWTYKRFYFYRTCLKAGSWLS